MIPGIFNYTDHVLGDTVKEVACDINKNLTGATLECVFLNNNERIEVPITVTDAAMGLFTIGEFTPNYEGDYIYDINFTFADDTVRTYLKGRLTVLSNDPE
jgi:hypothetical protein